ncbi:MAG: hypothetical protein ABIF40_04375 [archaeon]
MKSLIKKILTTGSILLSLNFLSCPENESFNEVLDIEGLYYCSTEKLYPEGEGMIKNEPTTWHVFQEDNNLFFTGRYGTFVAETDDNGNITAEDFETSSFIYNFNGTYGRRTLEGTLDREYLGFDWNSGLYMSGEKEQWGNSTTDAIDIKGFYDLEGNIIYQDCITEQAEENIFPSPFEFPAIIFQNNNAIYLWAYSIRLQENINENGTFEIDGRWETMRATMDFTFIGKINNNYLEGTFNYTYDYFNNDNIECRSEIEVYGERLSPWNEHIDEAFSGNRTVYFTALDYIWYKEN